MSLFERFWPAGSCRWGTGLESPNFLKKTLAWPWCVCGVGCRGSQSSSIVRPLPAVPSDCLEQLELKPLSASPCTPPGPRGQCVLLAQTLRSYRKISTTCPGPFPAGQGSHCGQAPAMMNHWPQRTYYYEMGLLHSKSLTNVLLFNPFIQFSVS